MCVTTNMYVKFLNIHQLMTKTYVGVIDTLIFNNIGAPVKKNTSN